MINTLQDFVELIHWVHAQGWSPATSTNYSLRHPLESKQVYLSSSGIDKANFLPEHFLLMSVEGQLQAGFEHLTPSAETAIHLMLYQQTDCHVVLHTHSKADTLLSRLKAKAKQVLLKDYELLKGFRNIDSHDAEIIIPIFDNDQDIAALSQKMAEYLANNSDCQAMLINSHGLYVWGRSLAEAKRHLEVCQFLFDCELELLRLSN